MVYDLVDRLVGRLEALKGTRTVVRVDHAFHAFTGDVIGRICFEDSLGFLADSDFAPQWYVNSTSWLLFLIPWKVRSNALICPINTDFHGVSVLDQVSILSCVSIWRSFATMNHG